MAVSDEIAEIGRLVADSRVSSECIGIRIRNVWPALTAALSDQVVVPGNDLLRAAERMRDILTADGDPPSVIVPDDIDINEFVLAFDNLAQAIRAHK